MWRVRDCSDIRLLYRDAESGVHPIHFELVYCDMDTDDGGWTVSKFSLFKDR